LVVINSLSSDQLSLIIKTITEFMEKALITG